MEKNLHTKILHNIDQEIAAPKTPTEPSTVKKPTTLREPTTSSSACKRINSKFTIEN